MNARYYGSNTNRWLSPDTIVPNPANPQSFNRYSYVSNNPVNFTDPSGHSECGVGQYHCAGDDYKPTVVILGGSYGDINRPGPTVRNQMPAWDSNPWGYDMVNIRYPGSKYEQFQAMIVQDIDEPQVIVGYSAGAEAALMYASSHPSVDTIILLGPTFTGGDVLEGDDIGFEGWSKYMEQVLANGTNIIIVDDDFTADRELNLWAQNAEANLEDTGIPPGTALLYLYRPLTPHYDEGRIKTGSNNNPRIRDGLFEWVDYFPE